MNVLVEKVRELVDAHPDNVYTRPKSSKWGNSGCSNTAGVCTDGSEGCLIGQALKALGFPVEDFENNGVWSLYNHKHLEPFNVGQREGEWLCRAQARQDGGNTWGEAVKNADAMYPLEVKDGE